MADGRKEESNKEKWMRCTRNILAVEKEVGEDEANFRKIGVVLRTLIKKRENIDEDNSVKFHELYELEKRCPHFSPDEFKEYCFLKYSIHQNGVERTAVCKRIAQLNRQSNKIRSRVNKNYGTFKTFAFMKEKLL